MDTLYILNKACAAERLEIYLSRAGSSSSVLFIEDAVYAAQLNSRLARVVENHVSRIAFGAIAQDLITRGIGQDQILSEVTLFDYDQFVQLCVDSKGLQFWF